MAQTADGAVPAAAESQDWRWRAVCCFLGLTPVGPLLAWMIGIGSYTVWWLFFTTPAMIALVAIASWPGHLGRHPVLRRAMISGTVGGIAATLAYDFVRVPFVAGGFRLFSPIDSFGMLMLNAHSSSPATEFAGWAAHFSDGVGFGIAYAMVALGRRWWFGPIYGVFLESMTLITPYAKVYGLVGHWDLIGLALGAHLVFGTPLGFIVRGGKKVTAELDELSRKAAPGAIAILLIGMMLWWRPWVAPTDLRTPAEVQSGVTVVIDNNKFVPEWTRIPSGGCIVVANHDHTDYVETGGPTKVPIKAGAQVRTCFTTTQIYRVQLSAKPYSGGFIMVDAAY